MKEKTNTKSGFILLLRYYTTIITANVVARESVSHNLSLFLPPPRPTKNGIFPYSCFFSIILKSNVAFNCTKWLQINRQKCKKKKKDFPSLFIFIFIVSSKTCSKMLIGDLFLSLKARLNRVQLAKGL